MNILRYIFSVVFVFLYADRIVANTLSLHLIDHKITKVNNHSVLSQNSNQAEKLLQQGTRQYQNNQLEAAIESWQEALKLYRRQKDSNGESLALGRIGLSYERLSNYRQAVNYFEQSLAIVEKTDNNQLEASLLGNLGNNYLQLSNYPQALESYQKSLAIWQNLDDRAAQGQVLRGLGNVQIALGNYNKAINLHQQSLKIAQSFNDTEGLIYSHNSLGAIYANQGNYAQATQQYQQSLSKIKTIKNPVLSQKLQAQTLNNLGSVTHAQRNYEQSLK